MVWCLRSPVWVCFIDETRKPSFSWTSQVFGFEKMLLFLPGNMFQFFLPMGHVKFRKM